jgi:hypothetical protein
MLNKIEGACRWRSDLEKRQCTNFDVSDDRNPDLHEDTLISPRTNDDYIAELKNTMN